MSRFEPRRGWPNSPGPNLRPLNNMCPTIVCKNGQPMYAVGARGGIVIDAIAVPLRRGGVPRTAAAESRPSRRIVAASCVVGVPIQQAGLGHSDERRAIIEYLSGLH